MAGPLIWNGKFSKNLPSDLLLSGSAFGGMQVGRQLSYSSSTGLNSDGILSINGGDNTKFDLTAGTGTLIDYATTPGSPTFKNISFGPFTAQTVTGLATQDFTYILINSSGNIVQLSNFPTQDQRRQNVFIGRISHSTRVVISFANSLPDFAPSIVSQVFDFFDALGPFNVSGNILSTNGVGLTFQKSQGSAFARGINYSTDADNPHVSTSPAAAPVTFAYITRTGGPGSNTTLVDPGHYDVGGVVTVVPNPTATATIQRVFLLATGAIRIQYGQNTYANLTDAVAAIPNDSFVENPAIANISILIGYIVVEKSCTDLTNTGTASILPAPRFGVGAGGGVNTVVSLQQTYNSSTQPQIVLTSTAGGFEIFDNAAPIGSNLFRIANSTGATNYFTVSATGISTTLPISSGTITANLVGNVTGTILGPVNVNAQTGTTYTVSPSDSNQVITLTNASPITLTIPNTLAVGTRVDVYQGGAGQITFTGSGGMNVFNSLSLTASRAQYSGVTLCVTATNTTILTGDLT